MTPIDKAIKALEQALWHIGSDEDRIHLVPEEAKWSTTRKGAATLVRNALSDLSSLKLEDGDVEKAIRIMKSARVSDLAPACVEHNAAVERLLALLGHGGEG